MLEPSTRQDCQSPRLDWYQVERQPEAAENSNHSDQEDMLMADNSSPTLRDELRKAAQQNSQRPATERRQMAVINARLAFASTATKTSR